MDDNKQAVELVEKINMMEKDMNEDKSITEEDKAKKI